MREAQQNFRVNEGVIETALDEGVSTESPGKRECYRDSVMGGEAEQNLQTNEVNSTYS